MNLEKYHPTKVFRYCPRCGKESFHPSSERSNECSECGFVLYFNSASAVCALIFNEEGKILLTRRERDPGKGMLDLPGGFVDLNESAENALSRELKEELNLEISDPKFIASFPNEYLFKDLLYFTCDLAFVCKANFTGNMTPNDDVSEFLFVDLNQLDLNLIAFESIRKVLRFYLNSN